MDGNVKKPNQAQDERRKETNTALYAYTKISSLYAQENAVSLLKARAYRSELLHLLRVDSGFCIHATYANVMLIKGTRLGTFLVAKPI